MGGGLAPLLRERSRFLKGIVNGVDVKEWDPMNDPHLPAKFSSSSLGVSEWEGGGEGRGGV